MQNIANNNERNSMKNEINTVTERLEALTIGKRKFQCDDEPALKRAFTQQEQNIELSKLMMRAQTADLTSYLERFKLLTAPSRKYLRISFLEAFNIYLVSNGYFSLVSRFDVSDDIDEVLRESLELFFKDLECELGNENNVVRARIQEEWRLLNGILPCEEDCTIDLVETPLFRNRISIGCATTYVNVNYVSRSKTEFCDEEKMVVIGDKCLVDEPIMYFKPVAANSLPDYFKRGVPMVYRHFNPDTKQYGGLTPLRGFKYQASGKSFNLTVRNVDRTRVYTLFDASKSIWNSGTKYFQLLKLEYVDEPRFITVNGQHKSLCVDGTFIRRHGHLFDGKFMVYAFDRRTRVFDTQLGLLEKRIRELEKTKKPKTYAKFFNKFQFGVPECTIRSNFEGSILIESSKLDARRENVPECYGWFKSLQSKIYKGCVGKYEEIPTDNLNFYYNDDFIIWVTLKN